MSCSSVLPRSSARCRRLLGCLGAAFAACNYSSLEPLEGTEPPFGEDVLGGQTGDGTGFDTVEALPNDVPDCEGIRRRRPADKASNAAELERLSEDVALLLAGGVHAEGTFAAGEQGVSLSEKATTPELDVTFRAKPSAAYWVTYESANEVPACAPYLELEYEGTVRAFGQVEQRVAVLVRTTRPEAVAFEASLPPAALEVDLSPKQVLTGFQLTGVLSDRGSYGQLDAVFGAVDSEDVESRAPVFYWPKSERCVGGGSLAGKRQWRGRTAREWQLGLDRRSLALDWGPGASTTLEISAVPATELCWQADWASSDDVLYGTPQIALKSADGRVNLSLPAALTVVSRAESAPSESASLTAYGEFEARARELAALLRDVELDGVERISITLSLEYPSDGEPTGQLEINTLVSKPCDAGEESNAIELEERAASESVDERTTCDWAEPALSAAVGEPKPGAGSL